MNKETINPPGIPVSPLPFSPAVRAGGLIFVSGQASVDDTGAIVPGTFEEEFRRSIVNMERILETAGSDLTAIVQTRNYVRDPADLPEFNRLYAELIPEPYPCRTTVTNCLPESLRFEIECVAVESSKSNPV